MLNQYAPPDPPANVEVFVTVPGDQDWHVLSVQATLSTTDENNLIGLPAVDSSGNLRDGLYGAFGSTRIKGGAPGLVTGDTAIVVGDLTDPGPYEGFVQTPAAALITGGSFSIEAWVSWDAGGFATYPYQAFRAVAPINEMVGLVDEIATGGLQLRRRRAVGTLETLLYAPGIPQDGARHHVVGVYNAGVPELRLYLDGVSVASLGSVGATSASARQTGRTGEGSALPHTVMDELALYPVALSGARVAAHYAARNNFAAYSAAVLADAPSGYYHLNETVPPIQSEVLLLETNGSLLLFVATPIGVVPDGNRYRFTWLAGLPGVTDTPAVGAVTSTIPNLIVPPGYTLGTRTIRQAGGFQWSDVIVWYDFEYTDGRAGRVDYEDIWLVP